jgi:hypothetical protein
MRTCLRSGWRSARGNSGLILTLWGWTALVSLAAGTAVWRWLAAAFNHAPWADRMLDRFHVGIAVELMQYDRFPPTLTLNGAVLALLILGAVSNPLVSAGVLEVIISRDGRPMLHRFFRGAGHFFGRFFRLLVISGVAALVLVIAASAVTAPIVSWLGDSSWERTWLAVGLARLILLALLLAFVASVLDVARARVALADTEIRGMLREWSRAARFVLRNFATVAGIYLTFGALFLAALIVYAGLAGILPTRTWGGILLAIVIQQLFVVVRAGLGVARAGATVALCRRAPVTVPVLQL